MRYAVKLNIQFHELLIDKQQAVVLGKHALEKGYGLVRHKMPRRMVYRALKKLPREVAANCSEVNYSTIQSLKPHVHTEDGCVINIYKTTNGEKTVFYEWLSKDNTFDVRQTQDKFYSIDETLLSEVEHFTAQNEDVWLLNTRQPHAVVACGSTREVVQIFLGMPFDEAKKRFI